MTHPSGIGSSNLLLQQSQLMLLNLNFARAGSPGLPRRPSLSFLVLKRLKRPRRICDPLGATPPDIVPLGSYTSPSSVTLRTPTLRANVTAWAEAASSQISVSLNTNAIASATSSG